MGSLVTPSRSILLIIGGGIAAYKSLELIRRVRERGIGVRVVMTPAAKQFVSPLTAAALSGEAVRDDLFSLTDEAEMGHIELSRACDLIVVAPATANLLARMAQGIADDLATTTLLATDKRVLAAPAMNVRMWLNPATQRNLKQLRADGVAFVGPDEGEMACGEFGPGRMAEPLAIVAAIERELLGPTQIPLSPERETAGGLTGRHVIVTAGPTHEPIDPVRYIGNRSSGLQGFAIARAAADAGARVTLVRGPVALPDPRGVEVRRVQTALEMRQAVQDAMPADVFIGAAAVADWRVAEVAGHKRKKSSSGPPVLSLLENPDILAEVASSARRPAVVIGFAAETDNILENAEQKRTRKGCDVIVANAVNEGSDVFGGVSNEVTIVTSKGATSWPRMSKESVARGLIEMAAHMFAYTA